MNARPRTRDLRLLQLRALVVLDQAEVERAVGQVAREMFPRARGFDLLAAEHMLVERGGLFEVIHFNARCTMRFIVTPGVVDTCPWCATVAHTTARLHGTHAHRSATASRHGCRPDTLLAHPIEDTTVTCCQTAKRPASSVMPRWATTAVMWVIPLARGSVPCRTVSQHFFMDYTTLCSSYPRDDLYGTLRHGICKMTPMSLSQSPDLPR